MKPFRSVNWPIRKNLWIVLLLHFVLTGARSASVNKADGRFLIGFKGGINFSQPLVVKTYNVFSSTTLSALGDKKYDALFANTGFQYAFIATYQLSDNLRVRFEPGFSHLLYGYTIERSWTDGSEDNRFDSRQEHQQRFQHFELPITISYQLKSWSIKPFVFGGIQYGIGLSASKSVKQSEVQYYMGTASGLSSTLQTTDVSSQFIRSLWSVIGGGGIAYQFKSMYFLFDASYYVGLNNVSNESLRYDNQLLSGSTYDVPDDIKITSLRFNLTILFPLNKTSNFIKSLYCN